MSSNPDNALSSAGASRFSSSCVSVEVSSICTYPHLGNVLSNLRSYRCYTDCQQIYKFVIRGADNGQPRRHRPRIFVCDLGGEDSTDWPELPVIFWGRRMVDAACSRTSVDISPSFGRFIRHPRARFPEFTVLEMARLWLNCYRVRKDIGTSEVSEL